MHYAKEISKDIVGALHHIVVRGLTSTRWDILNASAVILSPLWDACLQCAACRAVSLDRSKASVVHRRGASGSMRHSAGK
ncbi:MAG: hypothetical protein K9N21_23530 [Deltaproteobacteria bacterium]|nr:hypothetical protein [Deltaproteobacteria bacterium]